jgi:1-aminocyclopropane-1-carboxylate deaminase
MKREDLNHPHVSGNKWWKLKYNLEAAVSGGHDTILTFGGARSNHIYATAAAAHEVGLQSIGIIRGEESLPLNPTLRFAAAHGMMLHYVTRHDYRQKDSIPFLRNLEKKFAPFYLIPEGGTNALAVKGCAELGALLCDTSADYVCTPVGTAGTMAGLILGSTSRQRVIGFSALENGEFLRSNIKQYAGPSRDDRWELLTGYAYGGYAKRNEAVDRFMRDFQTHTNIPLDFVYTGKMMCAVFDLLRKGYFERGKTILALHTGGLQGNVPYP